MLSLWGDVQPCRPSSLPPLGIDEQQKREASKYTVQGQLVTNFFIVN